MAVLLEVQGLFTLAVAEPVNCEVAPTQADNVPVIVGNALAVKVAGFEVIDMVPDAVLVLTTQVYEVASELVNPVKFNVAVVAPEKTPPSEIEVPFLYH
jgi:hypothetical protein